VKRSLICALLDHFGARENSEELQPKYSCQVGKVVTESQPLTQYSSSLPDTVRTFVSKHLSTLGIRRIFDSGNETCLVGSMARTMSA
jgi:hypothetical protein